MRGRGGLILPAILGFVVLSRALLWTAHPPNFDFANFALGVERFDPIDHHPQPPGYPLVILLGKLLAAAGFGVVRSLHATALAGSLAAVVGAGFLGRRLSGPLGGVLACLFLAVEPAFWYSGLSSPARVYLAAGAVWMIWALAEAAEGRRVFWWVFAGMLALFSGFRPELMLFFLAPAIVAAQLGGLSWPTIAKGAALCLAACSPWLLWLVSAFGSPWQLVYVSYHYFLHHASTTSVLLGAPTQVWQGMLRNTFIWNGVALAFAVVGWLICDRSRSSALDRPLLRIAAAYLIPALAVQLAVHIGADSPDHALGTIALLTVTGGALMARAASPLPTAAAATAAIALAAVVDFAAPGAHRPEVDILSVRSFARNQRDVAITIDTLKSSFRPGDAILVSNDSDVSWRILEYEFPDNVVLALESTLRENTAEQPAGWWFLRGRQVRLPESGLNLSQAQRLQIFTSANSPQRRLVLDRLCAQSTCTVRPAWIQAELNGWRGTLTLPPYKILLQ